MKRRDMVSISYDEGDTTSQIFNNSSIRMDSFINKKNRIRVGRDPTLQSGSLELDS